MKEKLELQESIKEIKAPTQPKSEEFTPNFPKKVEKIKDVYLDAPNLTKEQRKQLGHASYNERVPEFVRLETKELITLQGITTSQINQALKATNPYPARVFLKTNESKEDIPIFFRIKENNTWTKPKIKKGSHLRVEGHFDNPINGSPRLSFTATSFQLLNQEFTSQTYEPIKK